MNPLGQINQCLGSQCPAPCCPNEVYILPEEKEIVLGYGSDLVINGICDKGLSPEEKEVRYYRSYISQCFDGKCKMETLNPDNNADKPQKGIICAAFPLLITNKERLTLGKMNLSLVSPNQCPLANLPEVIREHYAKFETLVQERFEFIRRIEFEEPLAKILGQKEICMNP